MDERARAAAEAVAEELLNENRFSVVHNRHWLVTGLLGFAADAVKERETLWRSWTDDYRITIQQQAEEIMRLRAQVEASEIVLKESGRLRAEADLRTEAAVAAERQWWIEREDDDFPCVTAGAPKGSCKHERWEECLYAAAALRAPRSVEPEANRIATPHITTRADIETVDALRQRIRDLEAGLAPQTESDG